ncbi:MAG TPA: hypothetical protein ENN99_02740 [Chloroflexi bacterium]|nr:hypothetical protein [Chloroflexota bacterium]
MHTKWQILIGLVITLIGVLSLIGVLFDVDIGPFCFAFTLIAAGTALLLRPTLFTEGQFKLLGNVRRYGAWPVADEAFYVGVGDVRLDLTKADVPPGETTLRVFVLIGDVRVNVPEEVGVAISSMGVVADIKALDRKGDYILTPLDLTSDNYEAAERRVRLETWTFVGSLRVQHTPISAAAEATPPQS